MPLTVGPAGHIDHGKTWLVRALTGKDTDRLPEEQERGISIELGYAPLELPDGRQLSVVDVPGHERFVRTMVAGATGIDLFLLAIDAAEGARPQTHEDLPVRVRSVQVHDQPVEEAAAGQRVAVNLAGLERTALQRGNVLVATGFFPVSYRLDVRLEELEPLEDGARLTVHHGTSQHPA